jgi:hypothetical protein
MEVRVPVAKRRAGNMSERFTGCLKCEKGVLIPLSDYGRDGAPIRYKAWVCNNPQCGFNIRIDNGEVSKGKPLAELD